MPSERSRPAASILSGNGSRAGFQATELSRRGLLNISRESTRRKQKKMPYNTSGWEQGKDSDLAKWVAIAPPTPTTQDGRDPRLFQAGGQELPAKMVTMSARMMPVEVLGRQRHPGMGGGGHLQGSNLMRPQPSWPSCLA